MGKYVVVTTTESDDRGPKKPGAINGGFFMKDESKPGQYPSVVIAVDDIDKAMKKVEGGRQGPRRSMDIPGIGRYVAFTDTEGNRVSMLKPLPHMSTRPTSH
jgi:predicted enzyme related to lactoylglutathione lyase